MSRSIVLLAAIAVFCVGGCASEIDSMAHCGASPVVGVWRAGSTIALNVDADLVDATRAAVESWASATSRIGLTLKVGPGADANRVHRESFDDPSVLGETARRYQHVGDAHELAHFDMGVSPALHGDSLVATVVHEMGHALGLQHDDDDSAAMFCWKMGYDAPQPRDVEALVHAYGAR